MPSFTINYFTFTAGDKSFGNMSSVTVTTASNSTEMLNTANDIWDVLAAQGHHMCAPRPLSQELMNAVALKRSKKLQAASKQTNLF